MTDEEREKIHILKRKFEEIVYNKDYEYLNNYEFRKEERKTYITLNIFKKTVNNKDIVMLDKIDRNISIFYKKIKSIQGFDQAYEAAKKIFPLVSNFYKISDYGESVIESIISERNRFYNSYELINFNDKKIKEMKEIVGNIDIEDIYTEESFFPFFLSDEDMMFFNQIDLIKKQDIIITKNKDNEELEILTEEVNSIKLSNNNLLNRLDDLKEILSGKRNEFINLSHAEKFMLMNKQ
jgi:hypothetical protein